MCAKWQQSSLSLLLLLAVACFPAQAETRRALLVGINDYTASRIPKPTPSAKAPGKPGRSRWENLSGAVNDVREIRELLIAKYGFRPADIKVLTDQEARREAILKAIREHLIAPARAGDEVVFFYAGHGSQVVNSLSDEPDKKDETIVPADSRSGAPDIRDKKLRHLFNEILAKEARLTVILDTCYSGSGARGLPSRAQARVLPLDPRDIKDATKAGPRPEENGALVFSASQDDERAEEVKDAAGKWHGAFTLALTESLSRSEVQAPTEQIFRRARARLQTGWARQEPVLAGLGPRRDQPLFGSAPDQPGGSRVVVVRQVKPDGTILLQGGWADGLREGNILELRTKGKAASVRIRVTAVNGPSAAEAKLLSPSRARIPPLESGDLFVLVGWTVSSEPWLRVWIPEAGAHWETILQQAREIRSLAGRSGFGWILDPVAETPTHVLSWEKDGWSLIDPAGEAESLGIASAPAVLAKRLSAAKRPVRLFVHLPAPPDLAAAIRLGAGTRNNAVERTAGPAGAHYHLVGRWNQGAVEYAWIHPAADVKDRLPLPVRTDWHAPAAQAKEPASPKASLPFRLEDAPLRIAKIRAWLTLESPPGDDFPYRLTLKDSAGKPVAAGALLPAQATYGLALTARPRDLMRSLTPRYIYVFAINSAGTSLLLFPSRGQGNVENCFPLLVEGAKAFPTEILLGPQPSFRIAEPFGMDTYFLLTSEEPIPNPWVLQFDGVRTRGPEGKTPLEELLSQRGSSRRSPDPLTPVTWSIEWMTFESRPPGS